MTWLGEMWKAIQNGPLGHYYPNPQPPPFPEPAPVSISDLADENERLKKVLKAIREIVAEEELAIRRAVKIQAALAPIKDLLNE